MLLDDYTGAAAAYSMRQLRSAYAGNCLKVRRSSDNTTQDIGFSGGWLDQSALASFVGANDGFVDTWYDQSTAGVNAVQATTTLQPRIVASGTISTMAPTKSGATARPSMEFGHSGVRYLETTTGLAAGQANGLIASIGLRNGTNVGAAGHMIIAAASYTSLTGGFLLMSETTNALSIWTDRGNLAIMPLEMGFVASFSVSLYSTDYRSAKNGAALRRGVWAAYTITPTKLIIGGWNGAGLNGEFGEVVYWNNNQSANELSIIGSQCVAFGVDIPSSGAAATSRPASPFLSQVIG